MIEEAKVDFIMKAAVYTGLLSGAAKYFVWVDTYAAGLGVCVSFLGVIVAAIYYTYMGSKSSKTEKNTRSIEKLEKQADDNMVEIRELFKSKENKLDKAK